MSETLHAALVRLAAECANDDARALAAPWTWTDDAFLWNEVLDHGVLNHEGTAWSVQPANREVIATSRNRLPELARVLAAAARQIDDLRAEVQQLTEANTRLEADGIEFRGCPCRHVAPCRESCTCANMFSSGGCDRCCSYGSWAQRQAKAESMIAEAADRAADRDEIDQVKIKLAAMTEARDRACHLSRVGYTTWTEAVRADTDQQIRELEMVGKESV